MRIALAGLLLVGLAAGVAGADDLDERVPVAPEGLLEVDLDQGEGLRPDPGLLSIQSHDAPEVRVIAEADGWGAWNVTFDLEHAADSVRLRGRVSGATAWLFGGPRMNVRVWVPRGFALDLRSTGVPIRVEDVAGSVRARTRHADVGVSGAAGGVRLRVGDGAARVRELEGDLDVRVDDGSIEARWIGGAVDARTGEGTVELEHVRGRVNAHSDGGAIRLTDVAGPVQALTERGGITARFTRAPAGSLETRRGSLEVSFPAGSGLELDARTGHGSVTLVEGIEITGERDEDRARGRVNAGGAPLRLFTARGSILLATR